MKPVFANINGHLVNLSLTKQISPTLKSNENGHFAAFRIKYIDNTQETIIVDEQVFGTEQAFEKAKKILNDFISKNKINNLLILTVC